MIRPESLDALRKLIENQSNYNLYNILSAIRGNDIEEEKDLKPITMAIRSYVGFKYKNCSGCDITWVSLDAIEKALQSMDSDVAKDELKCHYAYHLSMAVKAIGRKELLAFAKKHAQR